MQPGAGRHPGRVGQFPGGAQYQVVAVQRQDAGALTLHGQRQLVTPPGGHLVVHGDGVVDRGQFVVPVQAPGPDGEMEVDLCRYPDLDRTGRPQPRPTLVEQRLGHADTSHGSVSP